MTRILLTLCLLLLPVAASAQAQPAALEQAIAQHGYTPARLLQLGEAQLAQGQLGAAVASFERGLLLGPRDPQLQAALERTRAAASLSAPERSPLARAAHLLSLREWSWLALAAIGLLSAAIVIAACARRIGAGHAATLTMAGLLTLTASTGVAITHEDLRRACVLRDDTALQRSPVPGAESVAQLRAGEMVRMREAHGDFIYVETSSGTGGWLARAGLAPLAAASPST